MFEQLMQIGREWGFPAMCLAAIGIATFIIVRQNSAHRRKIEEERQKTADVLEAERIKHEQRREDENFKREMERETRMGLRFDEQRDWIQNTLIEQLEKSNSAIARMDQSCAEISATHRELVASNKLVVEHCLGAIKK